MYTAGKRLLAPSLSGMEVGHVVTCPTAVRSSKEALLWLSDTEGGGNYSMTSQCHTFQLSCEVSWIDAGSSIKFIWLQLLTVHFSDDCGVISVA